MALRLIRVTASNDFVSGQQIRFKVYDKNGNIIYDVIGNELGNTGVYYVEGSLDFTNNGNEIYTVIAEEITGSWKTHKTITRNSEYLIN